MADRYRVPYMLRIFSSNVETDVYRANEKGKMRGTNGNSMPRARVPGSTYGFVRNASEVYVYRLDLTIRDTSVHV